MKAPSATGFVFLLTVVLALGVNGASAGTAQRKKTSSATNFSTKAYKNSGVKTYGVKTSAGTKSSAAASVSTANRSSAKNSATAKAVASGKTPVKTSPAAGKSSVARSSNTKSSSKKSGKRSSKAARQRGQMTPTPQRITEIQEALAKNGALNTTPSGKWDDSTTEAMRRFQAAHGLNPSGKLDARSLNELGLGSTTAGIAAPAPSSAPRTSAASLPSDIQQ
jgi:peptidoglycan hydrolase-like protein with peptidoglycan-binding domain